MNSLPDVCMLLMHHHISVINQVATYDKLYEVRWMLDEIWDRIKAMWNPNQQMTVDEGMIMYKGKYCPIQQYMPMKPVRFGIKVWVGVGLGGHGQILIIDNYFTSVPLFLDLLETGTMAIGTLQGNRKYVPKSLFAKSYTKK